MQKRARLFATLAATLPMLGVCSATNGAEATPPGHSHDAVQTEKARVRLETEANGRTLVQATDGVESAWESDSGVGPSHSRAMPEANAKTFMADAEFDDPLVAGAARGYDLDYAGELMVEGRKLHRVLVTRKMTETFSVLVDDETYFIVMRVEHRTSAGGRRLQVVTHYEDFRPVEGVLLPHQVTVAIDGKVTQQTKIARIEANPRLQDNLFRRPILAAPPARAP